MANFETAKTLLRDRRAQGITLNVIFNNTTSTKLKDHGGPLVHWITKCKRFKQCESGLATPSSECTLRLPDNFAAGDGKTLEVVGVGTTQNLASEDACCGAMVKLLYAE